MFNGQSIYDAGFITIKGINGNLVNGMTYSPTFFSQNPYMTQYNMSAYSTPYAQTGYGEDALSNTKPLEDQTAEVIKVSIESGDEYKDAYGFYLNGDDYTLYYLYTTEANIEYGNYEDVDLTVSATSNLDSLQGYSGLKEGTVKVSKSTLYRLAAKKNWVLKSRPLGYGAIPKPWLTSSGASVAWWPLSGWWA